MTHKNNDVLRHRLIRAWNRELVTNFEDRLKPVKTEIISKIVNKIKKINTDNKNQNCN